MNRIQVHESSHLNLGLLMDSLFLLPNHHLLVFKVVSNINFDTKLITEFVDACALCAYNTSDVFLINVEFGGLNK